jgi:hypothetical protein
MIDTSHTTYARTSNNQKPSGEKDKPKGSRDECARPRVCVEPKARLGEDHI